MKLIDIALPYQKQFITSNKRKKIWLSGRQLGKSWACSYIAVEKALMKPNSLSLIVSVGARSAGELMKKCLQMAESVKILSKNAITYTNSADCIKFSTGSRVMSLPAGNPNALRGYNASCVILDEMAFIENADEVIQAITPTLTRDKNSQLIMCSTPAGKTGLFYKYYLDSKYDDDWYCQTTTIYQAVEDGLNINIDEIKALCPDPDVFEQEYCCKFNDEVGSMIDCECLQFYNEYENRFNKSNCQIRLGKDVGIKSDRSCLAIGYVDNDIIYIDDIIVLKNMSYENQLNLVRELNERYRFNGGYIDETGIGSAYAEFVNRKVSALLKGYTWTSSNKTPAYENLKSLIFQRKIYFNDKFKDMIIDDFKNVRRITTDSGKIVYQAGRDQNGHSDIVSSIVLLTENIKDNHIVTRLPPTYHHSSIFSYDQGFLF